MRHGDSLDKIVGSYMAGLCSHTFDFKGRRYEPKRLIASPLLLRGHTCPAGCGACCGSFSLDFLPDEAILDGVTARQITVDKRTVVIMSDRQRKAPDRWCRHLDRANGRCRVHARRPLACDFELIRLLHYTDEVVLTQKLYGRFWAMARLDGGAGTLCEMLPADAGTVAEVNRKLERLLDWSRHLGIVTKIPLVLDWIARGDRNTSLRLSREAA